MPKRIHYEWKKRILEEISKDRTEDATGFVIKEFEEENLKERGDFIWHHPFSCRNFSGAYALFSTRRWRYLYLNQSRTEFDEQSADDAFQQLIDARNLLCHKESKSKFQRIRSDSVLLGKDDLYGSLTYSYVNQTIKIWLRFSMENIPNRVFCPYQLMVFAIVWEEEIKTLIE